MNYEDKILKLFKNGYLKTSDLKNNNIPRVYLTKLVRKEKLERVSHGLYVKSDEFLDNFVVLQSKSKNAIFSHMTAMYLYGFSNRLPIKYDVTVNSGYNGSLQRNSLVDLHYIKKDLLNLGLTNYKLPSGNIIKIYDLERTICDIIKNEFKEEPELFECVLNKYLESKDKNITKLFEYSKKMGIYISVREKLDNIKSGK